MAKNYRKYYQNLENMNRFIKRSIEIDKKAKLPGEAKVRNFFRRIGNLIFGDHRWYSYSHARSVIRIYLSTEDKDLKIGDDEKKKLKSNIKDLFKRLRPLKKGTFVEPLEDSFKARFKKKLDGSQFDTVIIPDPVVSPDPVITSDPVVSPDPVVTPDPVVIPDPAVIPDPVVTPDPAVIPDPKPNQILPLSTNQDHSNPASSYVDPAANAVNANPLNRNPDEVLEKRIEIDERPFIRPEVRPKIKQPPAPNPIFDPEAASRIGIVEKKDLPPVSAKLLFHLQADEFGQNSLLEGMPTKTVLKYVSDYLHKRVKLGGKVAEKERDICLQLRIAMACEDSNFGCLKSKIQGMFRNKKPLLIPGGWIGRPSGHAMYYEIIPESENKATFRIFNTGSGSNEHEQVQIGVKNKIRHTEWRGIDKDKLLNPHFHMSLKSLQREDLNEDSGEENVLSYQDVYFALKKQLDVKPENCIQEEIALGATLMQPQRAGVCAYRSLMAFLKTKMSPNEFRRFRCDIRLQALTTFEEMDAINGETKNWRLVKKSMKQLSRKINRLYKHRAVAIDYVRESEKILAPVSAWVKAAKKVERQAQLAPIPDHFNPLTTDLKLNPFMSIHTPDASAAGSSSGLQSAACSHLVDQVHQLSFTMPYDGRHSISNAINLLHLAEENREYEAVYYAAIEVVKQIPLDPEWWKQGVQVKGWQETSTVIAELGEMARLVFDSLHHKSEADIVMPAALAAMQKLLGLQYYLTELETTPKAAHKHVGMFLRHFQMRSEREDIEYTRLNESENQQYGARSKAFVGYFDVIGPFSCSVGNIANNEVSHFEDLIKKGLTDTTGRATLDRINANSMKLTRKSFDQLELEERYLALFASEHLPVWLKAFRDTEIRLHMLCAFEPALKDTKLSPSIEFKMRNFGQKRPLEISIPRYGVDRIDGTKALPELSDKMQSFKSMNHASGFLVPAEKRLIGTHELRGYQGFDIQESKKIEHLFLKPSASIIETLEFFERHPDKISDPDYQFIFQAACFRPESMMCMQPRIAQLVNQFLVKHFKEADSRGNYGSMVFLLRMHRYFSHYSAYSYQTFPFNGQQHLERLLLRSNLEIDVKTYLYTELAAYLSEKPYLSSSEIKDFLIATIWKRRSDLPNIWRDPKVEDEIKKGLQFHSRAIEFYFKSKNNPSKDDNSLFHTAFNEIYKGVNDVESIAFWEDVSVEGGEPIYRSNHGDIYYPLKGLLYVLNTEMLLPYEIRSLNAFKALFPGVKNVVAFPNGSYGFKDRFQNDILIKIDNEVLVIEKLIDGVWHRYIPPMKFESVNPITLLITSRIQSRELINGYTHWQSTVEPGILRLYPHGQNNCEYIVEKVHTPQDEEEFLLSFQQRSATLAVTRLKDGARLSNTSSLFSHIEDPSYIHEWFKDGKLVEIELPRLKLSFTMDPASPDMLICSKYPGWRVKKDQTVSKLGFCKNYLAFEKIPMNEKEAQNPPKKQVILPKLNLKQSFVSDVITPKPEYDRGLESLTIFDVDHYVYEIDEKGELLSKSREAAFYLCLTYAANQDYKSAATLLKKIGEKLSPYSADEISVLEEITSVGKKMRDTSGEIVAISLYASFLLNQNSPDTNRSHTLEKLYLEYLKHYQNVSSIRLSKHEELIILKNRLTKSYEPYYFARLQELDPTYAYEYEEKHAGIMQAQNIQGIVPDLTKTYNLETTLNGISVSRDTSAPFNRDQATLGSLIRPEFKIKKYLPEYVDLAKNGTAEEKQWIESASHFLESQHSIESKALGRLFKEILVDGNKFESPPPMDLNIVEYSNEWHQSILQVDNWWKRICHVVSTINFEETLKFPRAKNITPPYFRLDSKEEKPVPVNFIFDYQAIQPLSEVGFFKDIFRFVDGPQTMTEAEYLAIDGWLKQKEEGISEEEDALQYHEWKRLRKDLLDYKEQPVKKVYELVQGSSLKDVKKALNSPLSVDSSKVENQIEKTALQNEKLYLADLERQMLNLANQTLEPDPVRDLSLLGGTSRKIHLNDILVSFALKNPSSLQQLNRHLTEDNLRVLYSMAVDYLAVSSIKTQRERCLNTYDKWKKAGFEEKRGLQNLLIEQLHAKRAYDVNQHPEYLVFEYYSGLIMREEQVAKLDAFLKGGVVNPIMEMIMGSGKSKVLLPLLGLMRANKKDLSLLIVPAPLFESVSSDTQKILGDAFSKALRTFHFDRNSQFTPRSLEEIRDKLKYVIKNQECLIMTSKSISALLLKHVEHSYTLFKTGQDDDKIASLMREILELLSKSSVPLIDEADTILNVLHEVSFSLGEKLAPKMQDGILIGSLFELLYHDEELKKLVSLESDPDPDKLAPPFTKAYYHAAVKRKLAEKFIERISNVDLKDPETTLELQNLLGSITIADRNKLLDYLCRDAEGVEAGQKFYDSLSVKLQNVFSLAAEEISHLLPHTLSKIANENYGLDEDIFATPYAGADNPTKGSVFNNPNVTMNYTFALYYKNGVGVDVIKKSLGMLFKDAYLESKESDILLSETKAYKKFIDLFGNLDLPLTEPSMYSDQQLNVLVSYINQSPERKQQLIVEEIFQRIEIFTEKLSCNPMMLINFFMRAYGFTGTLMNAGSMNSKLTPMPEIGTDAKTLVALYRMMDLGVNSVKKSTLESMLNELQSNSIPFDMISDAGGYFKEGGNLIVARQMAIKFNNPVVFYNDKNEQTVTDGYVETPLLESLLKENERLTFLDQSHTTGADIPQRINASAIVTIGRNMTLRDLFQAVWRLRGLEKGQIVQYLIDDEVESIVREQLKIDRETPLTFLHVLEFVIQNQCEKQGDDNFKAFKQELFGMAQQLLAISLQREDIWPVNRTAAFEVLKDLWIKRQDKTPAEIYGKAVLKRPKKEVLEEEGEKCRKVLNEAKEKLPFIKNQTDEAIEKIPGLIETYTPRVHKEIISPISDDSETVEVETETETEVETNIEIIVENQPEPINLGYYFNGQAKKISEKVKAFCANPLNEGKYTFNEALVNEFKNKWVRGEELPKDLQFELNDFFCDYEYYINNQMQNGVYSLREQMNKQPELLPVAPYFSDISLMTNVLEWDANERGDRQNGYTTVKKILGFYRTPIHHLRVDRDEVTILTLIESDYSNFNLYLGFTQSDAQLSEEAFKKIVKIKFLNGEMHYNKKELKVLEDWFKEADPVQLREFFLRIVLKYDAAGQISFPQTPLARVFKHAMK